MQLRHHEEHGLGHLALDCVPAARHQLPCSHRLCTSALAASSCWLTWDCLQATLERVGQRGNMGDLTAQPYYRFLQKTYGLHVAAQLALLYVVGGFPALVWGGAVRAVWVYHITWFVNSASHCWGSQDYGTGDLSRNNWCAACCRACVHLFRLGLRSLGS